MTTSNNKKFKKMSFQMFYTCSYLINSDEENPGYENIKPLFDEIKDKYTVNEEYKEVYGYNYDPVRLKSLALDEDYYHIVIERLDDSVLSKTTIYGESEDLSLGEEEYIGHEVNILYDYRNNVMILQNNISSLSKKGIELFINSLIFNYRDDDDLEFEFILVPALDRRALGRAKRKQSFSILGIELIGEESNNNSLLSLNKDFKNIGSVEIIIKAKSKNEPLDRQTTSEILSKWSSQDDTKKLWIKGRDSEEDNLELINLLKQTIKFYADFEYRKGERVRSESVYYEMKSLYNDFR